MKILLTGGGTMGPVSPLLAVVPELRRRGDAIQFIGTPNGPERISVEALSIPFYALPAPKLRRYFSFRHFAVPFQMIISLIRACRLVKRIAPDVIVSAGGFVSVPVVWAGWFKRIPSVIHQQDIQPGLANRLMSPCASAITVAFEESLRHFAKGKARWVGNPVRDLTPVTDTLAVDRSVPTLFIFGGGTGAKAINALVSPALCDTMNVIHMTGSGRDGEPFEHDRYHRYEYLHEEMKEAFAKADVVVARAGLGTISELAALGKPAIIIPMPGTHQEANAVLLQQHSAAVVLSQKELTPESLVREINALLNNPEKMRTLRARIKEFYKQDAVQQFASIIHEAPGR
ncbi:MAG: UDP-N-acetylglucosamine--N-acetylmuramyl-(pentapeptide) pyrophosphoryl-undecaprenol N-acetylglucosamine transferase [Candidatus Kerfeldbacteria bacterium]